MKKIEASSKKLNIIRIEDDSRNVDMNINEGSQNVVIVFNSKSRNIKLICGKNSKTKYIEINNSQNKNVVKRTMFMEKNSQIISYIIYAGTKNQDSSILSELMENSSIIIKNIILSENQEHNHDLKVIHKEKNSKSNLQSKGVFSDSKINIQGLIKIEKAAEESEGYQKTDMLILKDSEIVSIPNLEIHNNKVKCSHGSSITRIDNEKIFYLQSRGLDEENAKNILINSFFREMISELQKDEEEEIKIIIENKLSKIKK